LAWMGRASFGFGLLLSVSAKDHHQLLTKHWPNRLNQYA